LEEITQLIQTQRNGKALGEDKISIALLKNGGLELLKYLHKLILNIWKYEKIPEDWTEAVIIPLLKKGDKQECSNYRGISQLNTVYKIFSKFSTCYNNFLFTVNTAFVPSKVTLFRTKCLSFTLLYHIPLYKRLDCISAFQEL
jgi:hypothetical protein